MKACGKDAISNCCHSATESPYGKQDSGERLCSGFRTDGHYRQFNSAKVSPEKEVHGRDVETGGYLPYATRVFFAELSHRGGSALALSEKEDASDGDK